MPVESKSATQSQELSNGFVFPSHHHRNFFSLNPKPLWSEPPILPVMPQFRHKLAASSSSSPLPFPRLHRSVSAVANGFEIFSPVSESHPLSVDESLPTPPELIYRFDSQQDAPVSASAFSSPLPQLDFACVDSSEDVVLGAIPVSAPVRAPTPFSVPSPEELPQTDNTMIDISDTDDFFSWDDDFNKENKEIFPSSNTAASAIDDHDNEHKGFRLRNGKTTTTVTTSPLKSSPVLKPAVEPISLVPPVPLQPEDPEDMVVSIGEYTRAERRRKIQRFKQKQKNRTFTKKIIYKCRQTFAQSRPRVGGRFVSAASA